MKIIVGLGNPERKYDNTYHNVGFMAIDKIASLLGTSFKKTDCNGLIAETFFHKEKLFLVKPQTYMNLSGNCVEQLKRKYKLDNKNIFIILDDIDLPRGAFRFRESGSGGTHNGLKHIVSKVGQDVQRLRIGIGRDEKLELADYVLSKISNENMKIIVSSISEGINVLLENVARVE